MKKFATILLCFSALLMAAEKKAAPKAKAAPPPQVLTIPEKAVEVRPGLWEHKDPKGKTWHYTRTPFGVRKFEPEAVSEPAAEAGAAADEAHYITVLEDAGDTVRFERKMPFGKTQWTRKRAELNDAEKLALQKATRQPTQARTGQE